MNGYARLSNLKADLKLTQTDADSILLRLIEDVSRAIDNETGRIFYSEIATHYFDGSGYGDIDLRRDLLSVTALDIDTADDATYVTPIAAAAYWLLPSTAPYRRLELNGRGDYSTFSSIRRYARIAGMWGYSNTTELTGATAAEEIDASETGIDVSLGTLIDVGETVVIDSEQMYVSAIATNTLTVVRGINGTTPAVHNTATAVYRRRYEGPIERATAMQVTRIWRDQQTGYSGQVANSEFGGFAFNALYPAIRDLIAPYKRQWMFV